MRWSGLAVLIVCTTLAVTASAATPVAPTPPAFSGQEPFVTGDGPTGVAVADVNGDTKLDLVTANFGARTVSVLINDGRGRFQPRQDHPSPGETGSLAVADLDRDGRRDLLTADAIVGVGINCGTVSVFLNDPAAQFRLKQIYNVCGSGWIGTGDLNGDGKADFATVSSRCCVGGSGSIVALNDGSGSFKLASCLPVTGRAAAIGDLNGDGKQDLVTGANDDITVIINDGDWADCGSIAGRYETTLGVTSLALADVNHDGKRDVLTTSYRSGTVSVLLNKSGGHFGDHHLDYPTGLEPWSLAVADLNADHRLDLVTANQGAGTISVLSGRGNGTFESKRDYKTYGNRPSSVAIGDLNGDRLPDLAVANSDTDAVSVFFNRTTVCRVPNVKGKRLEDAKRALARAHCRASSNTAANRRVVSQRPAPGTILQAGGRVSLVIRSSK